MRNLKTVSRKQDAKLKHQGVQAVTLHFKQLGSGSVILKEISSVVSVFVSAKPLLL